MGRGYPASYQLVRICPDFGSAGAARSAAL